jgi:hypothetical protein
VTTRELIVAFAKALTEVASAAHGYHVVAAHQVPEHECRWPVCLGAREAREDIEKVVEKLRADELAT